MSFLFSADRTNVTWSYLKKYYKNDIALYSKEPIVQECALGSDNSELGKRIITAPFTSIDLAPFKNTPVIAFLVKLNDKVTCKKAQPNGSHAGVALYFRDSRQLFYADLLRYNMDGYKAALVQRKLKAFFMPMINAQIADKEKGKVVDLRVNKVSKNIIKFLTDHGLSANASEKPSSWFPLATALLIHTMVQQPSKRMMDIRLQLESSDNTHTLTMLKNRLQTFAADYYEKRNAKCGAGKIINLETNRCLGIESERGRNILGIMKDCGANKIRNPATKRCINEKIGTKFNLIRDTEASQSFITNRDFENNTTGKFTNMMHYHNYLMRVFPSCIIYDSLLKWKASKQSFMPHSNLIKFLDQNINHGNMRFVVFAIQLTSSGEDSFHANRVIYDRKTKETEIFEPHGTDLNDDKYHQLNMYAQIAKLMEPYNSKIITPDMYCPRSIPFFQSIETDQNHMYAEKGHCAVWATWYLQTRIANPNMTRAQVVKYAYNSIQDLQSFRNYIIEIQRYMAKKIRQEKSKKV